MWAVNDESLARAITSLATPLVCAVGHESDSSIAEWVADLRAPTPSAAAELLVPDQSDLAQRLQQRLIRLQRSIDTRLNTWSQQLDQRLAQLRLHAPAHRLQRGSEHLQHLQARLHIAAQSGIRSKASRLQWTGSRLKASSPRGALRGSHARLQSLAQRLQQQGTARRIQRRLVCNNSAAPYPRSAHWQHCNVATPLRDGDSGALLTSVQHITPTTRIRLQLKDGEVTVLPERSASSQ